MTQVTIRTIFKMTRPAADLWRERKTAGNYICIIDFYPRQPKLEVYVHIAICFHNIHGVSILLLIKQIYVKIYGTVFCNPEKVGDTRTLQLCVMTLNRIGNVLHSCAGA
jgi:hypothetical protein